MSLMLLIKGTEDVHSLAIVFKRGQELYKYAIRTILSLKIFYSIKQYRESSNIEVIKI